MIEDWLRDLRYAARGLRHTAGFSIAAVLTLAIGIGATTAVFSVVYGVLLRPLPFPTADRLVRVVQIVPSSTGGEPRRTGLTPEQIAEWRATSRTLAEIGSYSFRSLSLTGVPVPVRLAGAAITPPMFRATGVNAIHGRTFADDDELPGNDQVVILNHALWVKQFGAAPDAVGRPITLSGRPYRVIGVMPRDFGFPSVSHPAMSFSSDGELRDAPEFWVPLPKVARPAGPATGGHTLVPTFALIQQGVTLEQATIETNTLMPATAAERYRIELVPANAEQTRQVRRVLLVFQAAVLFVLFIACANVTNLLLARGASRQRDLAVRLALGASRGQIVRHAIAESSIIGVCGGLAGAALAYQTVALVRRLPPYVLPRLGDVRVDATALALASAIAIGAGIGVGLWTAARMLRSRQAADGGRGPGGSAGRHHRPSRTLVAAETAAGVTLLAGAALLLVSFVRMANVDRGFEPSGVYSFRVSLPSRLQPPAAQHGFHDHLTSTLKGMPGVSAAGRIEGTLGGGAIGFSLAVNGEKRGGDVAFQTISPGILAMLRIPLRGRDFSERDRAPVAATAIVSEAFARRYFPGVDPIGQRVSFQQWPSLEIVGVAGDIRPRDVEAKARAALYVPQETNTGLGVPTYLIRGSRDAGFIAGIRAAAARIDPDAVVFDAVPLDDLLGRQLTTPKFYGLTATGFAIVAVVLAALGLYGVLSYSVGTRTREFGIKIAIGATPRRVVAGVMREALGTVIAGVVIGLAGAYYSSRFLEALLFGVTPHDPALLAAVAVLFLGVAALASYVPARRATRVDPIAALRTE